MGLDYVPLDPAERDSVRKALRGNADGQAIRMSKVDTTFVGNDSPDVVGDEEVISLIRSVPVHY
jgi:hypothetical protein